MIKPDRHTNPDTSIINIGAFILKQLNSFYDISYDELMKKVIDNIGEKANENYPYALNFLYLLGKVKYLDNLTLLSIMQLSKIYSNKENFKKIKFNLNGLNVIYAEVKSKIDEKKNSHDLGKTRVHEID